jgi:hypothetical protein
MSAVTVLFVVLAVALTVLVYAFARASPIATAIGSSSTKHNGSWSFLPAVRGCRRSSSSDRRRPGRR